MASKRQLSGIPEQNDFSNSISPCCPMPPPTAFWFNRTYGSGGDVVLSGHFYIQMDFLAVLNICVALMPQIKLQLCAIYGSGGYVKNVKSYQWAMDDGQ